MTRWWTCAFLHIFFSLHLCRLKTNCSCRNKPQGLLQRLEVQRRAKGLYGVSRRGLVLSTCGPGCGAVGLLESLQCCFSGFWPSERFWWSLRKPVLVPLWPCSSVWDMFWKLYIRDLRILEHGLCNLVGISRNAKSNSSGIDAACFRLQVLVVWLHQNLKS